ncbi:MAG TPA: hypothetical protein VHQ65_11170, partial [Thermoanaerobaculia bacterium]|nr:hypothetical protein [Thermoanaerobaculia bacterium]
MPELNTPSTPCARFEHDVFLLLSDELGAGERRRWEDHLADCPRCRRERAEVAEVLGLCGLLA